MKYVFYQIGVEGSNLNEYDVKEEFSMERIKNMPERHKKHMIELFRIMADSLETGILSQKS